MAKLQHPTHDHPLVPIDLGFESIAPTCQLCRRHIDAATYACLECKSYYHRVCVEAPPQIDHHPLHQVHPLTLVHNQSFFRCDACDDQFHCRCSSFRCDTCDFNLDLCCALATLPNRGGSEQITLSLHCHPLTWFSTRHDFVSSDCVICRGHVEGDGYMCLHHMCKFLIHKGCIQDLRYADGSKAPLHHPRHQHPLEFLDMENLMITCRCLLCDRKVSSYAYGCTKCDHYYHIVCAKAPPQIEHHPLHPYHPLTLNHDRTYFRCGACSGVYHIGGSSFWCDTCVFDLDLGCAFSTLSDRGSCLGTTPEQINLPLHPHQLTSFSKRHDFVKDCNCVLCLSHVEWDGYMCLYHQCKFLIHKRCIRDLYYADDTKAPPVYHVHQLATFVREDTGSSSCAYCGSDESGEFMGCLRCKVFIHRYCIQGPETLQYPPHPGHTLVLFINHQEVRCQSCSSFSEGKLCYRCTSCEFSVHIGCALKVLDYYEEGMSAEIKLSWHKHPLILSHRTKSVSNCCFRCGDEVSGQAYACKEHCGFLLHDQCTKIESNIDHPYHPDHPLTLCTGDNYQRCKACYKKIVGFCLSCELCAFYLHDECGSRVPTRKHYLHEHELLHFDEIPSLRCNRCGARTDSSFFRCVPCDFNLHEKCMDLPRVVKHDTHVHSLILQETFVEDDTGEYYCDLCEKRRDGRLGVYVCGQCKVPWAFHIECVLPELQKVYAKEDNTAAIEKSAKEITRREEEVHEAERKLDQMKLELDELREKHATLTLE